MNLKIGLEYESFEYDSRLDAAPSDTCSWSSPTPSQLVRYLSIEGTATRVNTHRMTHFLPYSARNNFCSVRFDAILKVEEDPVAEIMAGIIGLNVSAAPRYPNQYYK